MSGHAGLLPLAWHWRTYGWELIAPPYGYNVANLARHGTGWRPLYRAEWVQRDSLDEAVDWLSAKLSTKLEMPHD